MQPIHRPLRVMHGTRSWRRNRSTASFEKITGSTFSKQLETFEELSECLQEQEFRLAPLELPLTALGQWNAVPRAQPLQMERLTVVQCTERAS
jgi:hypothetical protein